MGIFGAGVAQSQNPSPRTPVPDLLVGPDDPATADDGTHPAWKFQGWALPWGILGRWRFLGEDDSVWKECSILASVLSCGVGYLCLPR